MKRELFFACCMLSASAQAGLDEAIAAYKAENYPVAMAEFSSLATQGETRAQYQLARMYFDGKGVPQDFKAAAKWYQKAAAQGHSFAQYELSLMFNHGQGVTKDYVQAYAWLTLAAANHLGVAASNREVLLRKMSPAQTIQAEKLYQDYLVKYPAAKP